MRNPPPTNGGFTLIELLVVISIIGLLSSVILASLNSARAKSRDARRLADLSQVQTALELYYDGNGTYPVTNAWWGNCSGWGSHPTSGANGWVPNLAPNYIPVLPTDPKPSASACYLYNSNGTEYMLLAYYTVETYTQGTNPVKRPAAPSEPDFAYFSSGALGW